MNVVWCSRKQPAFRWFKAHAQGGKDIGLPIFKVVKQEGEQLLSKLKLTAMQIRIILNREKVVSDISRGRKLTNTH